MGRVEVRTAEAEGIIMRYAVFGQGARQMVILPGLSLREVTDSAKAVAAAYDCFSKDFTVYLFDRRLNLPETCTVRQMAADTASVMQSLGIQEACVFGASQGGMIAQFLAADAPALVSKLAIASAFCEMEQNLKEVLEHWIRLAEEGNDTELIRDIVERIYSPGTRSQYEEAIIKSFGPLTSQELERFRLCARACIGQETTKLLSQITCPAMVFGSEGDPVIPADCTRRLAEKLHADCFIYDARYGHALYDEAPDFKERLLTFFQGCCAAQMRRI